MSSEQLAAKLYEWQPSILESSIGIDGPGSFMFATWDQVNDVVKDVFRARAAEIKALTAPTRDGQPLGLDVVGMCDDHGAFMYKKCLAAFKAAQNPAPTRDGEVGRLREAAIRGALCLSGYVGEGISVVGCEDPEDAYGRVTAALGMPDADDDDLRAALATQAEGANADPS